MDEKQSNDMNTKVSTEITKLINNLVTSDLKINDIDLLGKLVDIHTDLANEDYWQKKKEVMEMRYRDDNYGREEYGNYGRRGVPGSGRRYNDGGSYGRRGVDSKYRGEEMMNEMHESYQEYSEGREQYGRGNYRAKHDTLKSLDYMMQSVVEFIEMLTEDAASQEEIELIKKYTRKISEM